MVLLVQFSSPGSLFLEKKVSQYDKKYFLTLTVEHVHIFSEKKNSQRLSFTASCVSHLSRKQMFKLWWFLKKLLVAPSHEIY